MTHPVSDEAMPGTAVVLDDNDVAAVLVPDGVPDEVFATLVHDDVAALLVPNGAVLVLVSGGKAGPTAALPVPDDTAKSR